MLKRLLPGQGLSKVWGLWMLCILCMSSAQASNRYEDVLPDWAHILGTYVDNAGRTDFKALADSADDLNRLKSVVDAIAEVSPTSHPEQFAQREQILSYHINAYNALAMYGVIDRGIPKGFTSFFSRASFFRFRDVNIGGITTNLQSYENKVIRPLDEPRIHFALNCMVRDCPRLPQTIFTAEALDEELEALTREFFSKPRHIRVDDKEQTLYLSAILKFYTEDFVDSGKKKDLVGYVNQYVPQPLPESLKVKFIDYDWRINQQPDANQQPDTLN